ncbi:carbamoyltransferase HypF [Opitutus sp. GAS368]|uniref:carbamoyltransferase HypF n=1 Tax=Opitutus sp. GAS368 TaxID=1882749 RepID=UPI00087A1219|nr:carbamoyltransferase HypF [Opitutus sp. GAS368]SDS44241.1 hydrogenase maturation protein HypF [Opitutus sp. GAS368]
MVAAPPITDVLLRVRGTVQGVGYRPFVHRTAADLGLRGWVINDAEGVLIRAAGDPARVDELAAALQHDAPPAATVDCVDRLEPRPDSAPAGAGFTIGASRSGGEIATAIPADLALCADCRRELLDPADRRHRYPFINCTQCGPRYSLIEGLPYDRPHTTMRAFPMCQACQREYDDPASRRFHAEPNACPKCGPHLTLCDAGGQVLAERDAALRSARTLLQGGLILAVKGLGGYHLMCDATNEGAVTALRQRKHRDQKPLAVMFRGLVELRAHAVVSPAAAALLTSIQAPIVLVPRRPDAELAAGVAPGNPWVGALLPSTPLHLLLLAAVDFPVVATSANLSEEPICTDKAEARRRLTGIADLFLEHDRPIAHPVDDSVVRLATGDEPILLRRARGYAPAPFPLPGRLPGPLLCVGGQMKNTVGVAAGDRLVLSPHLGDLDNLATQEVFVRTIATLAQLHGADFAAVAHDKHPAYASTRHAQQLGLPCVAVQHHLAHVLACLLEHHHPADGVLGIAWDGTGYGEDGTVWGGEFILLRQNHAERFARLRPFRLAGSEAAVRDARRVALGLAREAGGFPALAARFNYSDRDAAVLSAMLAQQLNSPLCSSAGRLFDGFGALLGLGEINRFEGQVPLAVEAAATPFAADSRLLPFPITRAVTPGARLEVDWRPAVSELLHLRGDAAADAAALHRGLVQAMVEVARQAGAGTVVLTGGCFQNALLHSLATAALTDAGFRVLVHRRLSPNDNSIAAGQALAVLWNLTSVTLPN